MVFGLIKKIVGTRNDREIKRIQAVVEEINDWENTIKPLTDVDDIVTCVYWKLTKACVGVARN